MSKLETNIIAPSTGTTITLGESGDTVALGSGATQTGFGGVNTPAFQAYKSSSQSLSAGATTKITFDSENFDTNSNYDTSTSRFTPTVAGKYYLDLSLQFDINATGALLYCYAYLYKNGSNLKMSLNDFQNGNASQHNATSTFIVDMNGSTDYIEAYGHIYNTGAVLASNGTAKLSVFSAYKIIE